MPPTTVILDVDPGVDDALAILLALRSPELEVKALTVVNGNVPLVTGTGNALKVLELAGRCEVPVYAGADHPLRREPVYATDFHGSSGLGDAQLPAPAGSSAGDAVDFLVRQLTASADLTIVAVGPLTNLALAETQAPGLLKRARNIVVMGGALQAPGNVTPLSEFNFFVDPEAARAVVTAGADLILVPLDATHQVELTRSEVQRQLGECATAVAEFCAAALRPGMELGRTHFGRDAIHLHDPLAVAVAIDETLSTTEQFWVDVETKGELTAGQLVSDRRAFSRQQHREGSRVRCAVGADHARVLELFLQRVFA